MDQALLSAIVGGMITGVFSVLVSFIQSNKTLAVLEERDKAMKEELTRLTQKVEAHNNFGLELAAIKERLKAIEARI